MLLNIWRWYIKNKTLTQIHFISRRLCNQSVKASRLLYSCVLTIISFHSPNDQIQWTRSNRKGQEGRPTKSNTLLSLISNSYVLPGTLCRFLDITCNIVNVSHMSLCGLHYQVISKIQSKELCLSVQFVLYPFIHVWKQKRIQRLCHPIPLKIGHEKDDYRKWQQISCFWPQTSFWICY